MIDNAIDKLIDGYLRIRQALAVSQQGRQLAQHHGGLQIQGGMPITRFPIWPR
jgi:hypothetical protein